MVEFNDDFIKARTINITKGLCDILSKDKIEVFNNIYDLPNENYIDIIPKEYKEEYKELINLCEKTFENYEADTIFLDIII